MSRVLPQPYVSAALFAAWLLLTNSIAPGPGSRSAIPAGDRKIPDPIVIPTTIVMAPKSPRRLGSASCPAGVADMRLWYSGTRRSASARGSSIATPASR